MTLFENTLALLLVAIFLLQISRRLPIPYPTTLAIAGVGVAALPWAPAIGIDPPLALALFIAPAVLDAAFDFPPREARRYWLPLLALAAVAVVMTTAAVAWVGVAMAGLPLAAAIALGAIVAPPDAAAATAVLGRFELPRSSVTVLKGESLFNDAVALMIFGAAVAMAMAPVGLVELVPRLALAAPGGLLLGTLMGLLQTRIAPRLAGLLGGTVMEFVMTFGTWIVAERLHLSAVLAVVAFGMTVARYLPEQMAARDRVQSYSVWGTAVFLLNVLAFLLLGLQARAIVGRLAPEALWEAMEVAGAVLAVTIGVRVAWVMAYNAGVRWWGARRGWRRVPTAAQGALVAWCGMRGLVTLATALALPAQFPQRDLVVLVALVVVLGTLILQGLTLGMLIHWLKFPLDASFQHDLLQARIALFDAAIGVVDAHGGPVAAQLREAYAAELAAARAGQSPRTQPVDQLRRKTLAAKRTCLAGLRRRGEIDDDVFHALEHELDWSELAFSPPGRFELEEG